MFLRTSLSMYIEISLVRILNGSFLFCNLLLKNLNLLSIETFIHVHLYGRCRPPAYSLYKYNKISNSEK